MSRAKDFNKLFEQDDYGMSKGEYSWEPDPEAAARGAKRQEYKIVDGTYYHKSTPQEVVDILERSRKEGFRIRLYYGDKDSGKDWGERHDITGKVGRSTGSIKIPLLISTSRSSGGGGILDDAIVKIEKTPGKQVLYQHPKYYKEGA